VVCKKCEAGTGSSVKVKVKQSHYRPGQAQRVLRKFRFPDFVTTAQDGGKVVSLTHRPRFKCNLPLIIIIIIIIIQKGTRCNIVE